MYNVITVSINRLGTSCAYRASKKLKIAVFLYKKYEGVLKVSIKFIINIPNKQDIASFCRKHNIKKLSIYGSALRGDLKPESDIDILVEFYKEFIPGFFKLVDMEEELSHIFGGRKVDLRTPNDLSRYFRNEVLETAEALHVES